MAPLVMFVLVVLVVGTAVTGAFRASRRAYRLAMSAEEGEVRMWCAGRSRTYRFRASLPIVVLVISPGRARLAVCGYKSAVWVDLDPAEVELTWAGERLDRVREPSSRTRLYVRAWRPGPGSEFLVPGTTRIPNGPQRS